MPTIKRTMMESVSVDWVFLATSFQSGLITSNDVASLTALLVLFASLYASVVAV